MSAQQVKEYQAFRKYLKSVCGIELGDDKQYLVSTRVRRILLEQKVSSLSELLDQLDEGHSISLRQRIVDAMTTNETFWFRDNYPFSYLEKTLIPEFGKHHTDKSMRIWCAACSTGQEPYSVSMIVNEAKRSKFNDICEAEIVATDVSNSVLESAKSGMYDRLSVLRGLSETRTKYHFDLNEDQTWVVKEHIKQRVSFRTFNLQDTYYLLGKFDVIFCRNVLIYFAPELRKDILRRLHDALNHGGILFLGASETIKGLDHLYTMIDCRPGVAYKAI